MKIEFFLNWLIFGMHVWNEKNRDFTMLNPANNSQMKFGSILFNTNITPSKVGLLTSFEQYLLRYRN